MKLYYVLLNDDTTGTNKFFLGTDNDPFYLGLEVIESLKLGKTGITESIIQQILKDFPYINRYWLETGEGNVYSFLESKDMGNELAKEVFSLRLEIDRQSQAIKRMENRLAEILDRLDYNYKAIGQTPNLKNDSKKA